MRVAYQGAPGAFGEEAIRRGWRGAEAWPAQTFAAVVDQVATGAADLGVLPLWNSLLGPILAAEAALSAGTARATGAVIEVPIELALLARPDATLATLRYVGSHPAALGQCRRFFSDHPGLVACTAWDTAGAARDLAGPWGGSAAEAPPWYAALEGPAPARVAAIAGVSAADRYGLAVLRRGIQDRPDTVTRFAVISRTGVAR